VLLVQPADGTEKVPSSLISALVLFSTTIDESSLADNVQLLHPDGGSVPVTFTLETLVVAGSPFSRDERTLLSVGFKLPPVLDPEGRFTLKIGAGVRSTADLALDQDPSTPEPEPFSSHFFAPFPDGGIGGGPKPCDRCPEGYGCVSENPGCVPMLACPETCPALSVCDDQEKQCVPDCRAYGLCFDPSLTCEQDTGLCR
jgi:hypothetical protein